MNCPKCNSNVNQDETFCKVCGYSLNQNQQTQQSNYSQVPMWDWNMNTLQNNDPNNAISINSQDQTIKQSYSAQNNNQAIIENINSSSLNSSIIENSNFQNNIQQEQQIKPQTVFNSNYSQNILNDDIYKEDMLIDAYIGKKADRLKKGGFSWCTFFFGTYYILYRKMWTFGIILWVIGIVVGEVVGTLEWLELIIDLIVGISAACIFKEKYMSHATKKVREIKEKNVNKTHEELMVICKKKGGTSILPILLIIGIPLIIYSASLMEIFNNYNKAKDRLDEINGNEYQVATKITKGELNIEIPAGFEMIRDDEEEYLSSYTDYSSNSSCVFSLSMMNAINHSPEEIIEVVQNNYKNGYGIKEEFREKNINGNNWEYTSKGDLHIYTIIHNEKVYYMHFIMDEENYKKIAPKHTNRYLNQ